MLLLAEGFLNLPGTSELLQLLGGFFCISAVIMLFLTSLIVYLIYRTSQQQPRNETDKNDD